MLKKNRFKHSFHIVFLIVVVLLLTYVIKFNHCLRVENLKELNHDSSSITIEWSIELAQPAPPLLKSYSNELLNESYENSVRSREQYDDLIGLSSSTSTTRPVDEYSGETGATSGSDEWIGFKIKYLTDKKQYPPILLKNINLRKFRLDKLKSNAEYKIQVSAFNKREMEGPASKLIVVRTQEAGKKSKDHFDLRTNLTP
jgi:hypothetical protein